MTNYSGYLRNKGDDFGDPTLHKAADELDRLRTALDEIVHPLTYMEERYVLAGAKIDGHLAVRLAADPVHLRGIAQQALASVKCEGEK